MKLSASVSIHNGLDLTNSTQELKVHYNPSSIRRARQSQSQDFDRLAKGLDDRTKSPPVSEQDKPIENSKEASLEEAGLSETDFCQEVLNTVKTLEVHSSGGGNQRESDSGVSSAQSTGTVPWGHECEDSIVL